MKFNFLQGDFSSGELSPRAQGHADSDAYKSGLKRAANVAPTRTGSIASRAGLMTLVEGIDGHTRLPSNLPVQHIPIHDGPFGDFTLEVSPTGIRMMDKFGVLPWNFESAGALLQFTQQDGAFAYADAPTRTVYLRSDAATGIRSYFLSKGAGAQNAIINVTHRVGIPVGTNEIWTLSGRIAGDSLTAHIVQSNPANFQDIALAPAADGTFSINFRPNVGGADQDFYIQLQTGAGTTATTLWDFNLFKNGIKTVQDTTTATLLGGTPLAPATFNGIGVATGPERVRAAAFWAHDIFWIAFAGGPNNAYAGFAMAFFGLNGFGQLTAPWTFGTLPVTTNSMAQIVGANAVAVFQDRLWYGVNLTNGKRAIRASVVGFGKEWGVLAAADSTGSTRAPNNLAGNWLFQFVVETETTVAAAGNFFPGAGSAPGTWVFPYNFPSDLPNAELMVRVDGQPRVYAKDFTVAGSEEAYETDAASSFLDQTQAPGGKIIFRGGTIVGIPDSIVVGSTVVITRIALAIDPLDLNLASPTAQIAWLNVLRGLILGTTRNEKLFTQASALSIDPATGQSFDVVDESSLGSDIALPAIDLNDHVLFAQRGRRVLRLAAINFATSGGLVADDVGVAGEHLTAARIRSMCYLKSPVPRVVFAFDNGTGAVMTLVGKGVAFSRFTIPACFGGIYSVSNLDSEADSELWVGTENGVTLHARTFESDIVTKEVQLSAAYPAAPTHLIYDTETPLPPVMDGWKRVPLVNQGGMQYAARMPACAAGQTAYALVAGQVYGPFVVAAGGAVVLSGLGLDKTWADAGGVRRATEVYVGIALPEHRFTTLPLEGGNPVGSSQNLTSRKPQLYVRLVDSYVPLVNGKRLAERDAADPMDELGGRVTEDRRATEEGFQRGGVVEVVMDLPLRMEISAVHGGVVMNNI